MLITSCFRYNPPGNREEPTKQIKGCKKQFKEKQGAVKKIFHSTLLIFCFMSVGISIVCNTSALFEFLLQPERFMHRLAGLSVQIPEYRRLLCVNGGIVFIRIREG